MPRIPIPASNEFTPEQRRVYDDIAARARDHRVGGPYQLALHCPEFLEKWADIGRLLRYGTSLPPRLSELAILVTARHWSCQYEWMAHEHHAAQAGLPSNAIEAIKHGRRPSFDDTVDEAVYAYCRELHETHFVSFANYERARSHVGTKGIVELTALIGQYAMIAMALNAHDYGVPDGTQPPLPKLAREADTGACDFDGR